VLDHEQPDRTEAEHHRGVAVEPVTDAVPVRQRLVLGHGQRHHVADAACVEIAGRGMVDGVGAAPVVIGREGQNPDGAADPVVHTALAEEGAVAAIVLNHEQAQEKPGCRRNGEQEAPPHAVGESQPGESPKGDERDDGRSQFKHRAQPLGGAIGQKTLEPEAFAPGADVVGGLGCHGPK
jgi:hypothetical protein